MKNVTSRVQNVNKVRNKNILIEDKKKKKKKSFPCLPCTKQSELEKLGEVFGTALKLHLKASSVSLELLPFCFHRQKLQCDPTRINYVFEYTDQMHILP